jgi:hypothetical protein
MTKKAIVSIDLASLAGTLQYVPGPQLPRNDKRLLELTIANSFLASLSSRDNSNITDVESTVLDPPDVTFRYNGAPRGIELSELLPEGRLEKDSIIRKLRRDIISQLPLSEKTKGTVVNIFFVDDYNTRIRPGRIDVALANALRDFFESGDRSANTIEVPPQIQDIVTRIHVFREDMKGDPRLQDDREPLLIFGAQSTTLVPDVDCPSIVQSRLSRKGRHDLVVPTWLLLWTSHHSLTSLRDELDNAIGAYLRLHPMKYERCFHLHMAIICGVTEFPNIGRS